jgi:hypothetical protein
MMSEENLRVSAAQAKFLMEKFKINDPNEAIDFLIEMMILEGVDPMRMKWYILKMMQEELKNVNSK